MYKWYTLSDSIINICERVGMILTVIKNEDILKVIGSKIQKARKEKGYTQDYVAEKIDKSIDIYRSIENGRSVGSVASLINICNVLNITLNDIFYELLDKKTDILNKKLYKEFQDLNIENKELIEVIIDYLKSK